MNETREVYTRARLLENLRKTTEAQQLIFKRMYADGELDADIATVVARMPVDKLDWAFTQVERTIEKNTAAGEGK